MKNYRTNIKKKDINISRPLPIKKLRVLMFFSFFILASLVIRIFWIQFINGSWLKEKAYRQQTSSSIISPKRGNIFDTNGKYLAISENVDTISINPTKLSNEKKELVAKGLSDIFELDYDDILEKVTSDSSVETIAKKVEHDKVEKLLSWMADNKITIGINIDEDNKRYYPYSNLASHVIGFCGTDNQGLSGIEASFDNILTGRSGKIITTTDINNSEISDDYSTYVAAEDGSDVYLTIDVNIQSIVEKYIKEAVDDGQSESASAIIMEPSTGNILSMATYPDFDLNTPFEPVADYSKEDWDDLSSSEKSNLLNKMWRNKNISDLYEPGSTFKVLVSSIALEEDISETNTSKDFYCSGHENINGTKIRCWSTSAHGYETLTEALANSCNPAFMQLGKKIGIDLFYKYFDAFGLFSKTGVSLPGESNSIFFDKNKVGNVELATMSFGQRFEITPIQLITAISAVANDGILVQPKIVSKTVNNDSNEITNFETTNVRQVISSETANKVVNMMESVVTNGTGKYGSVKGYTIAGKTGTSEPSPGSNEGNTLSYVAIAPSESAEMVVLVVLYNTSSTSAHGSTIVGPIISDILGEVLPYSGIASDSANIDSSSFASIPDVTNKTITEAEKILKNAGFTVKSNYSNDKNSTLVNIQVPSAGTSIMLDSTVVLYTEENSVRTSASVPNLKGLSLAAARKQLKNKNLNIEYSGSGLVASQSVSPEESVEEGTIIKVVLSN